MLHAHSLQRKPALESAPFLAPRGPETAKQILAHSETLCRSRGARMTPIRRKVLEVLLHSDKPLGAYDLTETLARQGRRMAPTTAYRALDFLIEHGLAYRLASRNAYIAGSGSQKTAAFLVCEGCGNAAPVDAPDVAETVYKVLSEQGYQPRARALEMVGRCAHCQDMH